MRTVLATLLLALAALAAALDTAAAATAATAPPALSAVTLNQTDVVAGTPVIGTVALTSAATPGGVSVALSSDDTAAATVPAAVTVPAGARTASFAVTTLAVTNPQSALIIGSAGGATAYAIITVRTHPSTTGSISILPAGNGSGTITSQPAGITCNVTFGTGTGACSSFFPSGTVVRLNTQARAGSKFQGWRGTPGCGDPSKITVAADTTITCQGGFVLK